jgi:hypothetical protein
MLKFRSGTQAVGFAHLGTLRVKEFRRELENRPTMFGRR